MTEKADNKSLIIGRIADKLPDDESRIKFSYGLGTISEEQLAVIRARLETVAYSAPESRSETFMNTVYYGTSLRGVLKAAVPDDETRADVLNKITGSSDISTNPLHVRS